MILSSVCYYKERLSVIQKEGLKVKKYKPRFKLVEAYKTTTEPYKWVVAFNGTIQIFSEEDFNRLFELASGCDNCICYECDKHKSTCDSCDIFSLKKESCESYSCSTIDREYSLEFNNSNKDRVFSTLSELQYNIYPSIDENDNPVIVVPKEDNEMRIPLNSVIFIKHGVITSYSSLPKEDTNGSI